MLMQTVGNTTELASYGKNYSEPRLWEKLAQNVAKIGKKTTWYVLILYYILKSGTVPVKDKAIILGALGYLILPVDLIPDAIPLLGFTDDAAAIKMAYDAVKRNVTSDIENKANQKLSQWF